MFDQTNKTAVVLAPHTDDGEIGCGGSIAKLVEQGYTVHYVAFSTCEESLPNGFQPNTLKNEVTEATKRLGIEGKNLHILDFPVRNFDQHRQDILEFLVQFKRKYNPSLVFAPSNNDIHQDHQIVAREAIRAFKDKTIFAYEMPWNNLTFETSGFFTLSEEHVLRKLSALEAYASQKNRDYFNRDFIISMLTVRGSQIKAKYAEAFDVIRNII